MRAPRWALALTSLATVGGVAFAVGLPAGSASAETPSAPALSNSRFEVTARGDAMYFEVNSPSIPASPNNNASSLFTQSTLSSTGGGTAKASTPYFGSTVQNVPGTVNGVPPQFNLQGVALPFTRLPGFVTCRSGEKDSGQFGYGRVSVNCGQDEVTAKGSQGAPEGIPAPNQQETSDASVNTANNGDVIAKASGTVRGFVMGPLEVGNALADATIRDTTSDDEPKITSSTKGTFSVSGQEFGFTEDGITFAGEGQSQDDALAQANDALKDAGIQIDIAPVTENFDDATGQTNYIIGGLQITSDQQGNVVKYILGRAQVNSVNSSFGNPAANASPSKAAPTKGAAPSTGSNTGSNVGKAAAPSTGSAAPSTGSVAPSTGSAAPSTGSVAPSTGSAAPSTGSVAPSTGATGSLDTGSTGVAPSTGSTGVAPSTGSSPAGNGAAASAPAGGTATGGAAVAAPAPQSQSAATLGGFTPTAGVGAGDDTEWLYLMIVLAGVAVFGGQAALSRFAAARA